MNEDQVRRSLEYLGQALSTGDLQGVTGCFAVPALFLSDDGLQCSPIPTSLRNFLHKRWSGIGRGGSSQLSLSSPESCYQPQRDA